MADTKRVNVVGLLNVFRKETRKPRQFPEQRLTDYCDWITQRFDGQKVVADEFDWADVCRRLGVEMNRGRKITQPFVS